MTWTRPRLAPRPTTRRRTWRLALTPLEDRTVPSTVWTQRGGDPGHSSYVDVSLDAAALAPDWNTPLTYTEAWGNQAVAIDDTRVYRTLVEGGDRYHVAAYNLADGSLAWDRLILGYASSGIGEPSVGGGIVYVNRAGHSGISGGNQSQWPRIYGLNAATGAVVLEHLYHSQWGNTDRPAIRDDQLVLEDGYYGGMASYAANTLTRQWFASGPQLEYPDAAIDDEYLYAWSYRVFRRADGAFVRAITHPQLTTLQEPVVAGSGRLLQEGYGPVNGLITWGVAAYDGNTHALQWTALMPGAVINKAVGNGVVAVTVGRELIFLDEATGARLRSWTAPANLNDEIVLTRTHAFVQSGTAAAATVHAINVATGQQDWSFEHRVTSGGAFMELAIGGGRLFLSHSSFLRTFSFSGTRPVNWPPDAVDDTATTAEDTAVPVAVLANDSDPDGDPITVAAITQPAHGSAVLNPDGTVTYTPKANYHGPDSFTYTISDGRGGTDTATVSLTVTPVNDPPVAAGWQFGTDEDTPLDDFLRASDVEGDPLAYAVVAPPARGTVQLNPATGTFTYTPAANWNGTDTFTFKVNDGTADSNVARVFVTVRPVNDAPVAVNDAFTLDEDTPLTVPAPGVLRNDTDVEGSALTAALVAGPVNGTLTLNADGSFTYTPNANFSGPDSFTYRASDGSAPSNTATVSLTVTAVNDAPVAVADAYVTREDTALTVNAPGVLANDTDVEGSALTAVLATGPAHGTLTLNADGSFTYTPNANFNGTDSFTYKANDGTADSAPATVRLTVTGVPDVARVEVNGGHVQRSRVTEIAVTFDTVVDPALLAGAFTLTRASDGLQVRTIRVATAVEDGRTVATLTFAGWGTQAGSLADGRWTLRVLAGRVRAGDGALMAADHTYALHRLFGDADGDRDVDAADELAFNAAYGTRSNQPGYVSYFDFDQDVDRWGIKDIDSKDRNQFRKRLGRSL